MSLIECKNINRYFGEGDNRVHVLKNINLSIDKGDFVAIIGQSGSGKSTLMNILGCLDVPTSGSYSIGGVETASMDADELAALRRKRFGFIFQRYNLLSSLSAQENVALPSVYAGMDDRRRSERARKLLQDLGLEGKETNKPSQLSGGQQQRVSIARALMNGGEIIFADEPTGALDSASGENVMEIIHRLHREGHTVIMVTHDPKLAAQANRIIEIKDGEIVSDTSKNSEIPASSVESLPEKRGFGFYKDQLREAAKMSVQEKILKDISDMGTNTITVYPGHGFGDRRSGRIKTLTVGDSDAIRSQSYVESTTPMSSSSGNVTYRNTDLTASLYGTGEQYFDVRGLKLGRGRLFDDDDVRRNAQVVVIDATTAEKLFPAGTDPLGQTVLFRKRPLQVIGVLKKEENNFGDSGVLMMWSPYTTVMNQITGERHINNITIKIKDNVSTQVAEKSLTELLESRHGTKDFFTSNSDSIKKTIESTMGAMTLLISSIAVISLVVGGIGVMNIMLVSVTERTKEIGVRMAIGARRSNILQQFLVEAVLLCLLGGLLGILLSFGIAALFNRVVTEFAMSFSTFSIVGAVLCSTSIGVLFGYMPAKNAAKLNPIDALAHD